MCERSVPQAAIPPPQMTIDDTNSRRNHKALSDYKHNERLTYYCWLNGVMGKVDCTVSQEFSRCFISRACLHFTGSLSGPQRCSFSSLFIPQVLFPSHDNFEVSTRVLMLLHSFPASVCAAILRNINVHPPPPRSCVFDKNLPGLLFPLSAAVNHLQLRLQQPPFRHMRSKQIQVRLDSHSCICMCEHTCRCNESVHTL